MRDKRFIVYDFMGAVPKAGGGPRQFDTIEEAVRHAKKECTGVPGLQDNELRLYYAYWRPGIPGPTDGCKMFDKKAWHKDQLDNWFTGESEFDRQHQKHHQEALEKIEATEYRKDERPQKPPPLRPQMIGEGEVVPRDSEGRGFWGWIKRFTR